jgi:hypothetical protein
MLSTGILLLVFVFRLSLQATPAPPAATTRIQIPLANLPLAPQAPGAPGQPLLCQNSQQYSSCTTTATNSQGSCNSLVNETSPQLSIQFYACICSSYEKLLKCFDLCADDPQLQTQKAVYYSTYTGQCSDFERRRGDIEPKPSETSSLGSAAVPTGKAKKEKEGPPVVISSVDKKPNTTAADGGFFEKPGVNPGTMDFDSSFRSTTVYAAFAGIYVVVAVFYLFLV